MKKLSCVWSIVLALLSAPVSATTLSFATGPAPVRVGDAFTLDVLVADVADLYALQFDIAFDPALMQAGAVLEGSFLSAGGGATFFMPGDIDNSAGTVSFTANTLVGPGPGASGGGIVVQLSFQALAPGEAGLAFSNVVLLDSAFTEIAATPIGGAITITPVPEPASFALFGLGLVALVAGARRRAPNPC